MSRAISQLYLEWLINQVGSGQGHEHLLALMHSKEFVFLVANDDNRIQDGKDLRLVFRDETGRQPELGFVSVLEVLVGLSKRLEFEAGGSAIGWALQLVANLELLSFSGMLGPRGVHRVEEVLDALVWRTYNRDGLGGFFPLAWPEKDQTKVEIWYQMSAYLDERQEL